MRRGLLRSPKQPRWGPPPLPAPHLLPAEAAPGGPAPASCPGTGGSSRCLGGLRPLGPSPWQWPVYGGAQAPSGAGRVALQCCCLAPYTSLSRP